jgi:hypothetical protein
MVIGTPNVVVYNVKYLLNVFNFIIRNLALRMIFRRFYISSFLTIVYLFFCCFIAEGSGKKVKQIVASFGKQSAIDLEHCNFSENVPLLYARHLLKADDEEYSSGKDGALSDSMLVYRISNAATIDMGLQLPVKELGYLYQSPELDSMARFGNCWFFQVNTLTDIHKKPLAYQARGSFNSKTARSAILNEMTRKYGKPVYKFRAGGKPTYGWQLDDRTIEASTSYSFAIDLRNSENSRKTIYYLDILIVDNAAKDAIFLAHAYDLPDTTNDQLWNRYRDWGFFRVGKQVVLGDEFLLRSANPEFIENKGGQYNLRPEDME